MKITHTVGKVMTLAAIERIVGEITFEFHPTYRVRVGEDQLANMDNGGTQPWLQMQDTALPAQYSNGRKWRLTQYMTESEVVGTVFAAYKAWLDHEMMESFKYKGVAVFNPHVSIEARIRLASDPDNYEYRS